MVPEVVYPSSKEVFKCSLSGHFMRAPTGIYSGDKVCHIFERRMILLHLDQQNPKLCPTCKNVVKRFVSMPELLEEIKAFRNAHPELDDKESFNKIMEKNHPAYLALKKKERRKLYCKASLVALLVISIIIFANLLANNKLK